ncbi:2-oxo-4-hydroxy-4-carboxy-5-ureidoimidazoline decarboxylase [uncultured Methylobacterium sp.]|uniref:2-oxo-4-hydroxy-4-carboxy-5-ureidoimidazoline decarboxylase n=1 Tax=uncultured Methylobacterium sp. TaxID=157278 RepID=UPI0035C99B1F
MSTLTLLGTTLLGAAMVMGAGGAPGGGGPVAGAAAPALDVARVNAMDRAAFVAAFGGVFENAPWVAEGAFPALPVASPAALHAAMMAVVRAAPADARRRLLNAHPELAGADARAKRMTDHSVAEQGSVGLDALTEDDFARFDRLNAAYREKFGFPFIIAVRGRSKAEIVAAFEHRLANPPAAETEAALEQVGLIARLRLERMLGPFG